MIQTLLPQFEAVIDREWNNADGSVKKSIPAYVTISEPFKKSRPCRDKKHVSKNANLKKVKSKAQVKQRRKNLKKAPTHLVKKLATIADADAYLRIIDLKSVNVAGDGDCLFHACIVSHPKLFASYSSSRNYLLFMV